MKSHLKRVDEPNLVEGSDIVADCGKLIENAVFSMRWDDMLGQIAEWSPLSVCSTCRVIPEKARFVYGIVSGPESSSEGTSTSQTSPSVGESG